MIVWVAAALAAAALGTPAPAPISLREIVEVTDLSSVALSPDGRTVVYRAETGSIASNTYTLDWYVAPVDGTSAPRRIADAGEGDRQNGTLLSDPPQWLRGSRWFIFRAVRDGQVQLWRAAADAPRAGPLTNEAGNVRAFAVAADGKTVVYAVGPWRTRIAGAEQAEYDRGIRIDSRIDPQRPLFRSARIEGRAASDRLHGFWFADGDILADEPTMDRTLDLGTGKLRDAIAAEAMHLRPLRQSPDLTSPRLVLSEADAGDYRGVATVVAAGLAGELSVVRPTSPVPIICSHALCQGQHIVNVAWQPDADRVVFTTSDPTTNQALAIWDVATNKVRPLVAATGRLNGGSDDRQGCAVGAKAIVCVAAAADVPPHLVAIDIASGRMQVIADPNAGLARPGLPRFAPFRWSDGAGHEFTGQLMLPPDRHGPAPLFVTYYVCDGYLRGGTGDEFPLRQLVASGIAALCINRLPTVPGVSDQVEQYRLAAGGIAAAVDRLVADRLVDRRRVGMGGLSFGSEVTAWVATHSDLLAAASVSSIVLTPTHYWFSAMVGPNVLKVLRQVWGLGNPDDEPTRWREISPALNIPAFRAPLLMQMPEQEFRDNVELAARLRYSPTPVELWAFPDEAHVKTQPRHKLAVYARNLDWFRYWLQGYVDPDPAKRQQYVAWQAFPRKPGWHDMDQTPVGAIPSATP